MAKALRRAVASLARFEIPRRFGLSHETGDGHSLSAKWTLSPSACISKSVRNRGYSNFELYLLPEERPLTRPNPSPGRFPYTPRGLSSDRSPRYLWRTMASTSQQSGDSGFVDDQKQVSPDVTKSEFTTQEENHRVQDQNLNHWARQNVLSFGMTPQCPSRSHKRILARSIGPVADILGS